MIFGEAQNSENRKTNGGGGSISNAYAIYAKLKFFQNINAKSFVIADLVCGFFYHLQKEYARYKQSKGWKYLVVYKSGIHALGLYTSQFISRGAMVRFVSMPQVSKTFLVLVSEFKALNLFWNSCFRWWSMLVRSWGSAWLIKERASISLEENFSTRVLAISLG